MLRTAQTAIPHRVARRSLAPNAIVFLGILPLGSFWWKLGAVWIILGLTCFCGWLQGVWNYTPPEISVLVYVPSAVNTLT